MFSLRIVMHGSSQRNANQDKTLAGQCGLTKDSALVTVGQCKHREHGATAARLTPDQKVGSSNLSGLILFAVPKAKLSVHM